MIKEAIHTLMEGKDLPYDMAKEVMYEMMEGTATQAQMAGATGNAQAMGSAGNPQAAAPAGTWTCSCGQVNSGKFCSECGKPAPAAEWTCSCGQVNSGKFCSNCGKPRA